MSDQPGEQAQERKINRANRVDNLRFFGGWLSPSVHIQLSNRIALANSKGWKVNQVIETPYDLGVRFFGTLLAILTLGAFTLGGSLIVIYERDDLFNEFGKIQTMETSSLMSLFWSIPVVAILAIAGAIFVSKLIRRSANDESLFDDDHDQAPANDGFNVKVLLAVIPMAALVIWGVVWIIDINAEKVGFG